MFLTVKALKRRWSSLRDSFSREVNRRAEDGEEQGPEQATQRPYKYFEKLRFLEEVEEDPDSEPPKVKRMRRGAAPSQDPDRLFMLSMVDELKKVS